MTDHTHPTSNAYLNPDGSLKIVKWADRYHLALPGSSMLSVDLSEREVRMAHSNATGQPLVSNGFLGVDLIRLKGGDGFVPHTHPGDHLLIVVGGRGTITYDGKIYPTHSGQVYMVEGEIPHAVGAITDHAILAVGAPHRPVGSPDRMKPVEYREIVARIGDLYCLICDQKATYPKMLHQVGCTHCPCAECNPIIE